MNSTMSSSEPVRPGASFTDLVGPSVRERKLLSLEEAVHRLSDRPARFNGLTERGRIAPG